MGCQDKRKVVASQKNKAPQAGLEPTTWGLTAARSMGASAWCLESPQALFQGIEVQVFLEEAGKDGELLFLAEADPQKAGLQAL